MTEEIGPTRPAPSGDDLPVVIVRGDAKGFAQEIQIGHHRLAADEPTSVGGSWYGAVALRVTLGSSGGLYLHDYCPVCAAQELAA